MSTFEDFEKEFNENTHNHKADYFKLKEGENKIVVLSMPKVYSEVYKIGIAYHDCGYGQFGSARSKCYIKDLSDGKIKMATFSYTVTKELLALGKGARTKFDGFPMPYAIIIDVENAGTLKIETKVYADEDYTLSDDDQKTLASLDDIGDILGRFKEAQQKKVESDPELQKRIADFIAEKTAEKSSKKSTKQEDLPSIQIDDEGESEVDEGESEVDEGDDIPFEG